MLKQSTFASITSHTMRATLDPALLVEIVSPRMAIPSTIFRGSISTLVCEDDDDDFDEDDFDDDFDDDFEEEFEDDLDSDAPESEMDDDDADVGGFDD